MRTIAILLSIFCATNGFAGSASPRAEMPERVTLLLVEHCLDCHSGPRPKGGLDLTKKAMAVKGGKSGPAVVPGKLAESGFWTRVYDGDMPPKKPLDDADKAGFIA